MKNIFLKITALALLFLFTGTTVVSAGSYNTAAKYQALNKLQSQYNILKSGKDKEKEKGSKQKDQGGKKGKVIDAQTVTLNKTSINLSQGSWVRLTATVKPNNAHNKKVVWATNNSKVAIVNPSGKITGVGPGTTVITAICLNGNIKATCTVTVTGKTKKPDTDTNTDTDNDTDTAIDSIKIVRTTDYIALQEDTSKRLRVTIEPQNVSESLNWSSNNTSIATVDRYGNVTGVNDGTAVITVKTSDGSKSDSCTVKVIDEDDWVNVRRVQINLVNTTIPVGFKENLKYRLEPSSVSDQEVKWSSSNPDVASVDIYGTVQGNKQGTAEITATSADGRRTDSCIVTVTYGIQPPSSGILLNKLSSTLEVGSTDFPTVKIYPAGSSNSLTWSSSDTSMATVNRSGEVTGKSKGTAMITVRTSDGKIASYVLIVTEP